MQGVTVDAGGVPLYEVVPEGQARGAVVVVQEVFGVNSYVQSVTGRLAEAGYHAVAPHLFHRTGSPELGYDDFGAVLPHVEKLDDSQVLADVDAALAHLNRAGWGSPQIGIVGFCFGGRVTFLVATVRPLGAGVSFYGGGIVTSRFPQFPGLIDRAPDLKTPWLGLFGELDESIPLADVDVLRTQLRAIATQNPTPNEVVVYEGARHGFHCDARPGSYDEDAARDGWERTLAWFERHLAPVG